MSAPGHDQGVAGPPTTGVRIVADVGATNARFATPGSSPHHLERIDTLRCEDYAGIGEAISAYTSMHEIECVSQVCLAVAAPVEHDMLELTNNHWSFSRCELETSLGAPVTVINDFTAQAMSVDALMPHDFQWFGVPRPSHPGIRTVLGPGTGLGMAVQMPSGEVIPSEGGHVGFAPTNAHEIEILQALLGRYGRVSAERLLSGPGLENLYWSNQQLEGRGGRSDFAAPSAVEVTRLAEAGNETALKSVQSFFDILASFAGDMALATWSTGGVFLSGGVIGKLSRFLDVERFRARFEAKGRFESFCRRVPLAWITHEWPGLVGCAAALAADNRS